MEEFIFGILATDQLKLLNHRARHRGLQHAHQISPRDPEPGQPITLTVYVGVDTTVDQVVCYYTSNGTQPVGEKGVAHSGDVAHFQLQDVVWDTLSWGYQQRWVATLPAVTQQCYLRYQIGAWAADEPEIFADWPNIKHLGERAASAFFRGDEVSEDTDMGDATKPYTFALSIDQLKPPRWSRNAVIYHIFVDRFFPGQGNGWLQTDDLNGFVGGTLWGVAEKLDYIAELGANTIFLSPIFCSNSHHGYDVTDYVSVEPRLGGDEALHHVVKEAHARGMRVVLDIALNHISDQHPYFVDARTNPDSSYRDWFTFDDSDVGYRSFFGVASMPQMNVANPTARQWLIEVARFWLREYDVDGFRLDVADGPGPDFWSYFWPAVKAEKADCFCFGEVVDAPDMQQSYVGRFDGLLDFHLCDAFRRTFAQHQWSEADFERFRSRHSQAFPTDFLMPTFIDNHDLNRFLFQAGGDKDALRRAAATQMSLPNPPIIYYGTEVGITQVGSAQEYGTHVNRVPMLWGEDQDTELFAYYKGLIAQRRR
ncbi:MAG: alpha-amylase [Anaerolineae bacterium]|nr:alpha-amylase [Anaerolineae bacterium]